MAKKGRQEIFLDDLDNVVGGNTAVAQAPDVTTNTYTNSNDQGKQVVSQQGENLTNTITESQILSGDGILQTNEVKDNTGDVKIGGNYQISNAGTGNTFNFS